ncbi:MAG: hypothetical protein JWP86_1155 [Phenylobacterium sp.]|nr:hypothetical protein [Phenylobacterium sp.]MDB5493818.1 hypothetical protein [Phenylobacterium sp.]
MRKLIIAGLAAASLLGGAGVAVGQPVVERWGHWDPTWGADPGPPPRALARHWRHRENHWYEHVHNCMGRERYNPHRDMYWEHRRWVPCRD